MPNNEQKKKIQINSGGTPIPILFRCTMQCIMSDVLKYLKLPFIICEYGDTCPPHVRYNDR